MKRPAPLPTLPPLDPAHPIADNHYWRYHDLEALLACKRPVTASVDEDLFIAVHQICELAFHQIILDLERAITHFGAALEQPADGIIGSTRETCYFMRRVVKMYGVVNHTLPVLMTLRGFSEFRTQLGPSSGFQSFQFRRLEIMAGVPHAYWTGGTKDAAGTVHVAETEFNAKFGGEVAGWFERYREANLRRCFERLRERGDGVDPAARVASLRRSAQAAHLLDWLAAFDHAQLSFHRIHLRLAVQQLERVGVEIGTGGTSFRDYLARYQEEQAPLFRGLEPHPKRGHA